MNQAQGEPVLVAVDFTADEVRLALADLDGDPMLLESYPLPPLADEAAWAWEVGGRISSAFAHEGARRWALGIGVACPGSVDALTGRIVRSAARPEWHGLAVVDALRRHIDAPIVAMNRTQAALRGEKERGAAQPATDALYVSLRGTPQAAVLTSSRIVSGAHGNAGTLAGLPPLDADVPLEGDALERLAARLAELAAFLDPHIVILEGEDAHTTPLVAALQSRLTATREAGDAPRVVASALGERAVLVGALRTASIVAFEGERHA